MKKIYITFILIICIFFCNSSFVYASDFNDDYDSSDELDELIEECGFKNEDGSIDYTSCFAFLLSYVGYGLGNVLDSSELSVVGDFTSGITSTYGQMLCPSEYEFAVQLLEGTADYEAQEEIRNNFYATLLETMVSQNAINYDIADNTLTISEDLASLYQAYLQNNVTPYVVHYSIPLNEVPASLFRNTGMMYFIRDEVMTNPDYNGDSTSENRIGYLRFWGGDYLDYYDVTGLSYVINNSLTMEDYDYSLVGGTFNGEFVHSFNSDGVICGNGPCVSMTYGGSSFIPYVYNVSNPNNYYNFYYTYDKSNQSYSFSYFVHASGDARPILFFRDSTALMEYMSGQSSCYMIPTDYNGGDLSVDLDMDYDEMYEAIQKAIQNGSFVTPSDLQSIIDSAVKEYQREMLDQLHDINNSLNNESGYSWLRLIYNYLNERLTTALSDLNNSVDALNEMFNSMVELLNQILDEVDGVDDVSGSTSSNSVEGLLQNILEEHRITNKIFQDMTEYLDDIIALLCEITDLLHNILDNFQNDYVDLSSNVNVLLDDNKDKFPLSLPHDYYLLFSLFNAEPKTPEYVLNFSVDSLGINQEIILSLSGFEILGRLSRLFFSIIFIFLLIPLTMKIIDFNERLVS